MQISDGLPLPPITTWDPAKWRREAAAINLDGVVSDSTMREDPDDSKYQINFRAATCHNSRRRSKNREMGGNLPNGGNISKEDMGPGLLPWNMKGGRMHVC